MLLDDTDGLRSFSDWKKFLSGLDPEAVGAAWNEAYNEKSAPWFMLSFHSAVIDRLLEIAHMGIDFTEEQRKVALEFADALIANVHAQFSGEPEMLARFDGAIENSRKFFASYGAPAMREFLFEQGLISTSGAELEGAPKSSANRNIANED